MIRLITLWIVGFLLWGLPDTGLVLADDAAACADGDGAAPVAPSVLKPLVAAAPLAPSFKTCPGYAVRQVHASFAGYSPAPSKVDGVEMPRTSGRAYRGVSKQSPQYDVNRAVSAMLGDSGAVVGIREYSAIVDILSGKTTFEASPLAANLAPIKSALNTVAKCKPFNSTEAAVYAMSLVDDLFMSEPAKSNAVSLYLDERSGKFVDFPTNLVFTSAYQASATLYGGQTIVIKETRPRGVDKHYWEFKRKGTPLNEHPAADLGEILTPGFLPPGDVDAYWLRKVDKDASVSIPEMRASGKLPERPIDWVFQKVVIGGRPHVLVFDGKDSSCVEKDDTGAYYACDFNYRNPLTAEVKPYPVLIKDRPLPLAAVVSLCQGGTCSPPLAAFNTATAGDRSLPPELIEKIASSGPAGATVAVFGVGKKKPEKIRSLIEIVSAKYEYVQPPVIQPGNVTVPAAGFCNGKNRCPYKVHPRFIGDPAPGYPKDFEIQYVCGTASGARVNKLRADAEATDKILQLDCPKEQGIRVVEATFGGNLKPRPPLDLKQQTSSMCRGYPQCAFNAADLLKGSEAPGSIEVKYQCSGTPKPVELTATVSGGAVSMSCPPLNPQ